MHKKLYGLHCIEHPLIKDKTVQLRQITTSSKRFRELIYEITLLLGFEATKDLILKTCELKTPLETFQASCLSDSNHPVIVPILRAGLGMLDAMLTLLPYAEVGHIGMSRNEQNLQAEQYYFKMPVYPAGSRVYVCDPMLATGGSAISAINQIKKYQKADIVFICILAAPEGVKHFFAEHPDVPIITACLDRQLNNKGYILPGLGDAGDRLFGTL